MIMIKDLIRRFIRSKVGGAFYNVARVVSGYDFIKKNAALREKIPIYMTPLQQNDTRYFYQLSFWAEFYQYFRGKTLFVPGTDKTQLMFWSLDFGYLPVKHDYDGYFTNVIKSPERALIRKAIKNGYTCREINYDEYLEEIHIINISKESRQGRLMISDYSNELKPRQRIVGKLGQEIHTFGCFDRNDKLVAYYMFELHGKNTIHTVKGIGHAESLKFGVMNYLFAYSFSELFKYFPDGNFILLYGSIDNGGGLSRFKRNVGCKFGCPVICSNQQFFNDLKKFNKKYKIHGDTGLNFVLENID